MTGPLPIQEAAGELGVSPRTIERWIARGCPVVRPGRRGGVPTLLDLQAVRAWRGISADFESEICRFCLTLASELPEVLAAAAHTTFCLIEDDPGKPWLAGLVEGQATISINMALDHLRKHCPDVPELQCTPEPIRQLRRVCERFGRVKP